MKSKLTEEIDEIKYLISFDRNKILSEQAPIPTPTPVPNNQTPVPTPAANNQTPAGNNTQQTAPQKPTENNSQPAKPVEKGNINNVPQTPNPTAMSASRIEQGNAGDPYQYKFEDDGNTQKYFYAKKGSDDWKQSVTPKSVDAIKRNIFKIR